MKFRVLLPSNNNNVWNQSSGNERNFKVTCSLTRRVRMFGFIILRNYELPLIPDLWDKGTKSYERRHSQAGLWTTTGSCRFRNGNEAHERRNDAWVRWILFHQLLSVPEVLQSSISFQALLSLKNPEVFVYLGVLQLQVAGISNCSLRVLVIKKL